MNIDLVSFGVGVVSSAVIPFVTWLIKYINRHSKYKSFKNLLLKEHVSEFSNIRHSDSNNQHVVLTKIQERINDLGNLKESLKESNDDCKYQILRLVDYTDAFLRTLEKNNITLHT